MKATDPNFNLYLQELKTVWGTDQKMIDYCTKKSSQVILLSDGVSLIEFEQPRIENRFCFGYSTCGQGAEYEDALETERYYLNHMEECFLAENRKIGNYDEMIADLEDDTKTLFLSVRYFKGKVLLHWNVTEAWRKEYHPWAIGLKESFTPETEKQDRQLIIAALRTEKEKHEKRLARWWKRNGADKCRTWTYWVDE